MEQTTQNQKNIWPIIAAVVITAIVAGGGVYLWQNQKTQPPPDKKGQAAPPFTDLTACGDFPKFSGGGGEGSRYVICRDSKTGDCYYKQVHYKQIPDCDPEYDKYDYGKEECFNLLTDIYNFDGAPIQRSIKNYQPEDACEATTQDYFESNVKE